MTLHWWMHWFWVTYFITMYCLVRMEDIENVHNPENTIDDIPPTSIPPLKSYKSYKKHLQSKMETTTNSAMKATVIDHNTTLLNENFTENVSLNIEDRLDNQSRVINSEQIGTTTPVKSSLTVARITGVTVGFISFIVVLSIAIFIMYRNSTLNRPQVLNDHCSNPDSSGYIDDSIPENSEEMYSLDNDSFLNSLEAVTIQNLWTVSVKHTKL